MENTRDESVLSNHLPSLEMQRLSPSYRSVLDRRSSDLHSAWRVSHVPELLKCCSTERTGSLHKTQVSRDKSHNLRIASDRIHPPMMASEIEFHGC